MTRWFLFFFLCATTGWTWIFIQSDPFQADVFIDGNLVGKTPCVLTNGQKKFSLAISKPGYKGIQTSITITTRITNLSYTLPSESFHANFPGYDILLINGKSFPSTEVESLSHGIYQIKSSTNTIIIHKINPYKPFFFFSLGIASTGVLAGTIGILLGNTEYERFKNAQSYEDAIKSMQLSMFYDNLALWSYTVAALSGGYAFAFFIDDKNFQKQADQFVVKKTTYLGKDKVLYDKAMDNLSQQKQSEAIPVFQNLVHNFPESPFIPPALYQWGKILKEQKKYQSAENIWSQLLTTYPVVDFYELTLYELFDMALAESAFEKAEKYLTILRSMMFFYTVEDMDWLELSLYRQWSKQNPTKLPLYQQKKEAFIHTRSYSAERRQLLQQE